MTEEQQRTEPPNRRTAAGWVWFAMLFLPRILLRSATAILAVIFLIVLAVALIQTVWISPRDVAYRFSTLGVAGGACERQARYRPRAIHSGLLVQGAVSNYQTNGRTGNASR
jgi:hypothetical protein